MKNQKASELEYYLWCLKVYIGILFKESQMVSRVLEGENTIVNKQHIISDLGIARNIFNVYKNKGDFYPKTPGSVIRVRRWGKNRYFDYVDCPLVPIIGIALPYEFIFCLPFDKGRTSRVCDSNKIPKDMDELTFRFYIADMGYDEYRWEESYSSLSIDNVIHFAPGSYKTQQTRPFRDSEFIKILDAVKIKGKKVGDKWEIEPK